jgi:hypothetical protein
LSQAGEGLVRDVMSGKQGASIKSKQKRESAWVKALSPVAPGDQERVEEHERRRAARRARRAQLPKGGKAMGSTARLANAGIIAGPRASAGRQQWRCHSCGEVLDSWSACERHVRDQHRPGARFDVVLDEGAP